MKIQALIFYFISLGIFPNYYCSGNIMDQNQLMILVLLNSGTGIPPDFIAPEHIFFVY
jgi:hypothetical protein